MAVSITKYPGGFEYPTAWQSSVKGLTPQGTYTVSFEEALRRFPGLEYQQDFKDAQASNQIFGGSTPTPATQTTSQDSYSNTFDQYQKAIDDAKAKWDAQPTGTQQSFEAYKEYQAAVKAMSDWSVSSASWNQPPSSSSTPATNQEDEFKPTEEKIQEFENKLLDQSKGEAVDWSNTSQSQEVAQTDTSNWPSIKDRQEPPIIQPGTGWPTQPNVPPTFRGTPSGTYPLAQGPRGEQIASILPPAMSPAELQRAINSRGGANPGTKEYGELRDLQKEWIQRQKLKGAEAPFDSGPDRRFESAVARASTAPEEQKALGTFQSEYDPQKARAASAASKEYRRQAQTEDPFRQQAAFG